MGKLILKSRFSVQATTPNKHRIIIKLMKKILTTEVSAGTTVIITVICLSTAVTNSRRRKLES